MSVHRDHVVGLVQNLALINQAFGVGEGDTLSNFDKHIDTRQSLMVTSLVYTTKVRASAWK